MVTPNLTVVCAWCHQIVRQGATSAEVTHTICPQCAEWILSPAARECVVEPAANRGDLVPPPGYFGDYI